MSIPGFWGLHVLPGKTYTQVVDASFRVSMASFGEEIKSQDRTCVKVAVDDKEFVLCALTPKCIEQQLLDHNFMEGEEVTFSVSGPNIVHLTGNYIPDHDVDQDPYDMSSDEEDDNDESEEQNDDILANGIVTKTAKRLAAESSETAESEEVVTPKSRNEKKRAAQQAGGPAIKKQKATEVVKKAKAESKKEEKKEQPKAVKVADGLTIEDIKVGTGPMAKAGQRIGMRYIGKLANGKVFDKNVSGTPFSFGLGRGEVIKGWDMGIVGMQIGGERRLTIAAPLAYGNQSLPGIPKRSTLIFEVKLLTLK